MYSIHGLPKDLVELHRVTRRFTWGLLRSAKAKTRMDISTLLAALMGWEFIVEDAITVAGGRAVGLSTDEIVPLLATKAA